MCVCVCVSVRMPSMHACRHACMHACVMFMHVSCAFACLCMCTVAFAVSGRDSAVHMTFDYLVYVCTLLGATEIGGGSACVLD